MPPIVYGWTQCVQVYCGQYFQTDTAARGHPVVCPNCNTQYLCEESDDPPEPPEPEDPEMLMAMASAPPKKSRKKTA